MNTINTSSQVAGFSSGIFKPMADCKPEAGQVALRCIKKGENSKLAESVAIAVPMLAQDAIASAAEFPLLASVMRAAIEKVRQDYVFAKAASGVKVVQFAELEFSNLESWLQSQVASIVKFDAAAITAWYKSQVEEFATVILAQRLGMDIDNISEEELIKLDQISAQFRDNFAKATGKGRITYSPKVLQNLNWMLDSILTENEGDVYANYLKGKINPVSKDSDLLDNL